MFEYERKIQAMHCDSFSQNVAIYIVDIEGEIFTYQDLMNEFEVPEASVKNAIKNLRKSGWLIDKVGGSGLDIELVLSGVERKAEIIGFEKPELNKLVESVFR